MIMKNDTDQIHHTDNGITPAKSTAWVKAAAGIAAFAVFVAGIAAGIKLTYHPRSKPDVDTAAIEETVDWKEYIGPWCDKGNENNTESPRELYQIHLKSVDEESQTVVLDASCFVGKRVSVEDNLEGTIQNNRIEIGFYDFYGNRIEGDITANSGRLSVVLEEIPEKAQKSDTTPGTIDMPLEMNCIMVRDGCADTRDRDRSAWDTTFVPAQSIQENKKTASSLVAKYSSDYVFPDSDKQYLDLNYLRHCSARYLVFGRNEIFARHGRQFTDQEIQDFFTFRGRNWYQPILSPEEFEQSVELNEFEKKNIDLILQAEAELSAGESNGSGFVGVTDSYQFGSAPIHRILIKEIYTDHVVADIQVVGPEIKLEYTGIIFEIINDTTILGKAGSDATIQITWPQIPDGTITASSPDNPQFQEILNHTYVGKIPNYFSN